MPKKPPEHNEKPKSSSKGRKRILLIIFFCITFSLAATIFALGTRKIYWWHQTTRPLKRQNDVLFYTIEFLVISIPICAYPGMLVATVYYWRKESKYGEFQIQMRRNRDGRGYWIDPSDIEDKKKEGEASKVNKEIEETATQRGVEVLKEKRTIRFQDELPLPAKIRRSILSTFIGTTAAAAAAPQIESFITTPKYSSVNPYGWFPKAEEPAAPQQQLGRSDSVKTCKESPIVKKGVADIWLNNFGKKASGAKTVGRNTWDEDVEMGTFGKKPL
jgi:hypothetical protein